MRCKRLLFLLFTIFSFCACSEEEIITTSYKVIAHRGFWKDADGADNSLAGLSEANRLGVDGVELDICKTADDSLVVAHGDKHGGYVIAQTSFRTLRDIRLSNGELLPTLREYLKYYSEIGSRIELVIELKDDNEEQPLLDLIDEFGIAKSVKFISCRWNICTKLRELNTDIHISYINGEKTPQQIKDAGFDGIDYEIYAFKKHPEWLEEARKLGLTTNVWVIKTESDLIWCAKNRLDYITTDSPLEAKQFLSRYE